MWRRLAYVATAGPRSEALPMTSAELKCQMEAIWREPICGSACYWSCWLIIGGALFHRRGRKATMKRKQGKP
jgi:hypothetical protein